MSPKLRPFFYLAAAILIIFIAIKPYNWFCQLTSKCQQFYLSELMERDDNAEGAQNINIIFQVKNTNPKVSLTASNHAISTLTGKYITVDYKAKNLYDGMAKFKIQFYVKPKELEEWVKRRDCLCFNTYKLKNGETIDLHSSFKIIKGIETSEYFDLNKDAKMEIIIGYVVR